MASPPWLTPWLTAFERNAGDRFAALATVSPAGLPQVRTVVVRGLDDAGRPYFATDARSAKIDAVRAGSEVELCVWWPASAEQFRLGGPAELIETDDHARAGLRRALWARIDAENRALMLGPAPGSAPVPGGSLERDSDRPAPTLTVVVVEPRRVDHLTLAPRDGSRPSRRARYRLSEGVWQGGAVVP